MSFINIKYTAKETLGASIKLFDVDNACVASFADVGTFKVITGAKSIEEYNDRPVRFKMTKREH